MIAFAVLIALFVGFCLGAAMGDVFDWYYRRKAARRQDAWARRQR